MYSPPTPDALIAAIEHELTFRGVPGTRAPGTESTDVAAIAAIARRVVIHEAGYVLRHSESIDKVKGAADGFPNTHVLWDAGELLLREFDVAEAAAAFDTEGPPPSAGRLRWLWLRWKWRKSWPSRGVPDA